MEELNIRKWVSGSGSGSGSGYGYGYGSGSGYGSTIKFHYGKTVYYIDNIPTIITNILGNYAKGFVISKDFSIKPCYIAKDKATNLFAHGKNLHEAQDALQKKVLSNLSLAQRIEMFTQNFKIDKRYKGHDFFNWHNILTGSCLFGRNQFVEENKLSLEAEYTVLEFIKICENAYGGSTIKKLKEYYK